MSDSRGTASIPPITALIFMKLESQRVPRKNLREVGGRPLFEWIFEVLESSRHVEKVILNTDSELIADRVSGRFNVKIHMRPQHLLEIQTNEANQIIGWDLDNCEGEFFLQSHSTNPLLTPATVDRAVETFFRQAIPNGHDSLFSVTAHRKRFFFEDGRPVNHDPAQLQKTQELPPVLEENSCVYLFSRSSFSASAANRIGLNPYLFQMDATEAVDIDTEGDLRLADALLRTRSPS